MALREIVTHLTAKLLVCMESPITIIADGRERRVLSGKTEPWSRSLSGLNGQIV